MRGLSLSLIGDSYRVEGFDIGLAGLVRENLRGTQLTPVFGMVGGHKRPSGVLLGRA